MPYVDLQEGEMNAYDKITRLIAIASTVGTKQKELINNKLVEVSPWEGEKFKGYFSVAVDNVLISFRCREPYAVKQILRITGE